jgi:type III secretory pathway lipoprotein EscJ
MHCLVLGTACLGERWCTYKRALQARLDERSAAQMMVVLRDHAMAVSKLQDVLKQDALDVSTMRQERAVGAQMLE